MAAPSFNDLYEIGKAELLLRRPDLFLSPGDVTDFIVAAIAAAADKCIQFANEEMRKTFIDGATGDDLTTLVDDHYGIQRSEATQSTVTVAFTRLSATTGAGTIPAGTTVGTEVDAAGERIEFTTDTAVTWGAIETGTKTVAATAVDAGISGNVGANTITDIIDSIFDSNISVDNSAAAAGGNAEESDAQLRERVRNFPATIRRGTLAALEFGALTVDAVRVATAVEDTTGNVSVYVTDETGASNAQMVADVATELDNWRCAGSTVTVTGGSLLSQDVTISLTVTAGTNVTTLTSDIEDAITAKLAKLPVGDGTASSEGVLRREKIQAAVISVDPDRILGVTVTLPAADTVPGVGQVIRVGTITVS